MKTPKSGGGWHAIRYVWDTSRDVGGAWKMFQAMRAPNACKTCALGMGGQRGGMVNEKGHFPEVCKKSIQAMAADLRGPINPQLFAEFSLAQLATLTSRELERLGRLTVPLYAGPHDTHFTPLSWEDAFDRAAAKLKQTAPEEGFFYFSGRSSNEAGFLLQLMARVWGTNHVNNCSYYCHQASGVGLNSVVGSGTATVVLEDIDRADLVFLIGANPASNHPRLMKSLIDLRRRGGQVVVVNPLKETGLVRFRVPSDARSLLFGSKIADHYLQPHIGGDMALMVGIAKALLESDDVDHAFLEAHTEGHAAALQAVRDHTWDHLVAHAGIDEAQIRSIADLYARSKGTIFCWAMGITHHANGVDNVQAIGLLALLRGMVGRPGAGLLPLRGHSNVQGIGSMGVKPEIKGPALDRLQTEFGITLPTMNGLDTMGCMDASAAGKMRLAWCLGGNLYASNPDLNYASASLGAVDQIVYLSTTMNTGHLHGRGKETLILPVLARDEETQPTTQESMFNYVRLSEGGTNRYEGPRSEVDVVTEVAQRVFGDEGPIDWAAMRDHTQLRQAISRIIPGYAKIGELDASKQEFQLDGRTFHAPTFGTPSGKAQLHVPHVPAMLGGADRELRVMTIRSEGQFNTVVYEEEDHYRGQERRDVILMNAEDVVRLGLEVNQRVTVATSTGRLDDQLVRIVDIPPGNAAMYYPEANVLVSRALDPKSKTPAFKGVVVEIVPSSRGG